MKETLQKMILNEHSKEQRDKVVAWVGERKDRFHMLMEILFGDVTKLTQRASWAVLYISKEHPAFVKPYIGQLLQVMENPLHDAILRHGFLILEGIELEEAELGHLVALCFEHLQAKTPTAIKRAALVNLAHIIKTIPELKEELALVLEDLIPHSTVGFVSFAKKVLKKIK